MINPDINRFLGTLLYPISDPYLSVEDPFIAFFGEIPDQFIDFDKSKELQKRKEKIRKDAVRYIAERYTVDGYDEIYQYMERWYLGSINWRSAEDGQLTHCKHLYDVLIQHLEKLSKSMISKLDGQIIYKYWKTDGDTELLGGFDGNNKIHLFRSLTQMLPMDILVAMFAQNHESAESVLTSFYGNVAITDAPLEQILSRGIAENHLHMGVSTNFLAIWDDWMRTDIAMSGISKQRQLPIKSPHRESNTMMYFYYLLARCLRMYLMICITSKDSKNVDYNVHLGALNTGIDHLGVLGFDKRKDVYKYFREHEDALTDVNIYFKEVEQELSNCLTANPELYGGWLPFSKYPVIEVKFLYEAIHFLSNSNVKDEKYVGLKQCFLDYLRIKHGFFGWLIQDKTHTGLDYFQTHYGTVSQSKGYVNSVLREANDKRSNTKTVMFEKLIRAQMATPNIRCIEFRTAIEDKDSRAKKELAAFLSAYRNILRKEYCIQNGDTSFHPVRKLPRIGIVYHFLKSYQEQPDLCGFSGDGSIHAYQKLHDTYRKQIQIFKDLRNKYPGMDRYLLGIDVASLENTVPTWVFSDIFEDARDGKQEPFSGVSSRPFQSLRFTCHAGEDFRHLLSGLRRVYEVVHYLKFHAGDRIGHGLALGISVDDWYQEHPNVILPRIEALENYLWAYQMLSTYPSAFNGGDLLYLEQRIHTLSSEIFAEHISTRILLQSYDALFNRKQFSVKTSCNQKCKQKSLGQGDEECPLIKERAVGSYSAEAVLQAYHCHQYTARMNEPIHYHVPTQEISILKDLQGIMQNMIAKAGIIVEANPSSNVIISGIDTLHEHPMYQLSKYHCDYKDIMLCINSDDPGVFQTNTANELGIAYMGMIEHGIGRNACLEWIERMRESGMRSSFIYQNDSDEAMLQELDQLLEDLEKLET